MSYTNDDMIKEMIGKTFESVRATDDSIVFKVAGYNTTFTMNHGQSCCESVSIESIEGNLSDLEDVPLVIAEERTSDQNPPGITKEYQDSFTWTFYEFATIKGRVSIRWYGESNGYYSEEVSITKDGDNASTFSINI